MNQLFRLWRIYRRAFSWVRYGDANFPPAIYIETHNSCNRKCKYCQKALGVTRHPFLMMTGETFGKILDSLQEMKWSGILGFHNISEPLLDRRLTEWIGISHGILPKAKIKIETNGDFLTLELADELVRVGVMRVRIARHAPFNVIRDAQIESVLRKYPRVFWQYTLGIDAPISRINQLQDLPMPATGVCRVPFNQLAIRTDGSVALCCQDYLKETNFGNVMDSSLLEIWASPEFVKARRSLLAGIRPTRLCRCCDIEPKYLLG
jgi:radical SAM protein with 4Fe4S-binding SPASM domain